MYEDYNYRQDAVSWRYGTKKIGPFWNKREKLIIQLEVKHREWYDPNYGNSANTGNWEYYSTWREMTLADAHNFNMLELYYSVYGKEKK